MDQLRALVAWAAARERLDLVGVYAMIEIGEVRGLWHASCDRVSFAPRDLDEKYCGWCHVFLNTEIAPP